MASPKLQHEIRDPIHNFIRINNIEREIINSLPVQRLRHIHQLAMTYMVYPAATHRRFEHSLGVMHLAGQVFDKITNGKAMRPDFKNRFAEELEAKHWRQTLRLAALCHDIGHLPFSHAAERDLLPEGKTHEHITLDLIRRYIKPILDKQQNTIIRWEQVAKIAVGQKIWLEYVKKNKDLNKIGGLSPWEEILSEIIIGDALGVDRMDYLLRDAHHTGVAYGKFDHHRLIDTLKVLPEEDDSDQYALGVEAGGVYSAAALLLARYFMYTQVYFHRVRRVYNFHLQQCMLAKYGKHPFPTTPDEFIKITDNEIMAAIRANEMKSNHAEIINERRHYKRVKEGRSTEISELKECIENAFPQQCFVDIYDNSAAAKSDVLEFPVEQYDSRVVKITDVLDIIGKIPSIDFGYIFVARDIEESAQCYIKNMIQSANGKQ